MKMFVVFNIFLTELIGKSICVGHFLRTAHFLYFEFPSILSFTVIPVCKYPFLYVCFLSDFLKDLASNKKCLEVFSFIVDHNKLLYSDSFLLLCYFSTCGFWLRMSTITLVNFISGIKIKYPNKDIPQNTNSICDRFQLPVKISFCTIHLFPLLCLLFLLFLAILLFTFRISSVLFSE